MFSEPSSTPYARAVYLLAAALCTFAFGLALWDVLVRGRSVDWYPDLLFPLAGIIVGIAFYRRTRPR
ncbi:MAG TPA: hypothetical protein VK399_09055 [Longimicrobiaceae bacterium]|jgi:hypothetical protein|nr:hypothetical protein [Longimicrobiaceae bacterium]